MDSLTPRSGWIAVVCDSLEKVFADTAPRPLDPSTPIVAFRGERAGVQIAVRPPLLAEAVDLGDIRVVVDASPGVAIAIHAVDLVPVSLPAFEDADEHYLRTAPGLYPDLLRPSPGGVISPVVGQWRAAWIDLEPHHDAASGAHTVSITLESTVSGVAIAQFAVPLWIPAVALDPLQIPHTEWFHCDGLVDYYGEAAFSEENWATVERFVRSARRAQVNTLLTPVWTPPLDTEAGGERTRTQLLTITEPEPGRYEFDFSALRRWIEMCRRTGMEYLEIPHLFTQWGARATPPIYIDSPSGAERRFGWHVPATDPRYRTFLEQLLPQLTDFLDAEWGLCRVFFHISDEPTQNDIDSYSAARALVSDLLDGCTIVDALADIELHRSGVVPYPVVANDHAQAFLDDGVDPFWLYYCVAQNKHVANRYIALPSTRNRVLGAQLFVTRASGFLQWGFNFYNSFLSRRSIDPFSDTTAGSGFLGGDAFLVYPGPGGVPWESLRHRVLAEAFIDYRALRQLAVSEGFDAARAVVDPENSLTLDSFSYDPEHYRRTVWALARRLDAAAREATMPALASAVTT